MSTSHFSSITTFLALLLTLSHPTASLAQNTNAHLQTIHLKDGSLLRAKVRNITPQFVIVKTPNGLFKIPRPWLLRISFTPEPPDSALSTHHSTVKIVKPKPNKMLLAGISLTSITYGLTLITSVLILSSGVPSNVQTTFQLMIIPIVGPFISVVTLIEQRAPELVIGGVLLSGLLQTLGLIFTIAGINKPTRPLSDRKWLIVPWAHLQGAGLSWIGHY